MSATFSASAELMSAKQTQEKPKRLANARNAPENVAVNFGTYDLETDPFAKGETPKAFAAGVLDPWGNYRYFWGKDCVVLLVAYMLDHPGRYYAHNGGRFDLDYVLRCRALPFERSEIVRIGGRVVKIQLGDLDLRDSYSLLPTSLAKLGTGKKSIDIAKMHRSKRAQHREEILHYLSEDCFSLHRALLRFFSDYGDCLTLAAAAWRVAKARFDISTDRLEPEEDEELRRFYYGGRVQVFEGGEVKGPMALYDINSAYPAAMIHGHFAGNDWHTSDRIPKNPGPWFVEFEGEAAGLPTVDGGSLSFAPRKGKFFATGWEFHQAKPKLKGKPFVYLPGSKICFAEYVEHFFAEKAAAKERGDDTGELFAKLLLNSLYGKYGQNPAHYRETVLVPLCDAIDEDDWEVVYETEAAGYAILERPLPADKIRFAYKHVGVSASITGFVRAYLAKALAACRRPVYCDTDSILCGKFSGDVGAKLGQWKHETNIDVGFIAGKKMYALHKAGAKWTRKKIADDDVFVSGYGWTARTGWKVAHKGIGKEMTIENLIEVARGGEVEIERLAPTFSFKAEPKFIRRKVRRT